MYWSSATARPSPCCGDVPPRTQDRRAADKKPRRATYPAHAPRAETLAPQIGDAPGSASPYFFTLSAALATHGSLRIAVVGANDGRINDPIFSFANKFKASTELFLIEPQKALLPHLRTNYGFHPRAKFMNQAIGPVGTITLYSVDEAVWPHLRAPYAENWPAYRAPTGVTSGERAHVIRWLREFGRRALT